MGDAVFISRIYTLTWHNLVFSDWGSTTPPLRGTPPKEGNCGKPLKTQIFA
jgi:hypothetical protein